MSFIEVKRDKNNLEQTTYKKRVYMRPTGKHIVRVLPGDPTSYTTFIHWINNRTIECLGSECPVCLNNKRIIAENPDTFRKVPGYSARSEKFYVNILDRTPVKICPNCSEENTQDSGRFTPVCSSCGSLIQSVDAVPCNKVKILSRGVTLRDELNKFHDTVLDENGERIGITNFDVQLIVGSNAQVFAVELENNRDVVTVPQEELFDITDAVIKLSADEMMKLYKGTALKDIFAGRSSSDGDVIDKVAELEEEKVNEINEQINSLLDF